MALNSLRKLVIYILSLLLLVPSYSQAKELKAVYAQDYLPFSWSEDDSVAKGVEVDFVNAVLGDKLGMKMTHIVYPWARAQAMVQEGQADIMVTIPNKKRRSYALVSDIPLFSSNFLMHTGVSNPKKSRLSTITNLKDLIKQEDIIHGHIVGAGWHSVKLKGVRSLKIAPSSLQILQLLDRNRIDVYIEQTPLIRYQIKTLGFEGRIEEIPHILEETHWHICLSKKSSFSGVMPQLNALLVKMKNDGTLLKLQEEVFSQYQ